MIDNNALLRGLNMAPVPENKYDPTLAEIARGDDEASVCPRCGCCGCCGGAWRACNNCLGTGRISVIFLSHSFRECPTCKGKKGRMVCAGNCGAGMGGSGEGW